MTTTEEQQTIGETGTLTPVPDPEPEAEKGTEYVVFKLREYASDGPAPFHDEWEQIGIGRGSYHGVIKELAGQIDGVYSAAPTRSWRPVRLAAKVEVTVTEL